MEIFKENKKVWDKIYDNGVILDFPDDTLVRFVNYLFKNPENRRLLDLGFGSGNNLIYLIKRGFDCYGCELSQTALDITQKKLDNLGLSVDLKLLESRLPYPDSFFDIAICWRTLYYNDEQGLDFMLKEIKRVLKDKGKFLGTLIKKNDASIVNCADKISNNVYKYNNSSFQEGAVIYVVDSREQIKELFDNFSNLKIGYFGWNFLNRIGSQWVIYGEKLNNA